MNYMLELLAQAPSVLPGRSPEPPPTEPVPPVFFQQVPMEGIWDYIAGISWQHAVGLIAFGLVYLMYGWRLYKLLVEIDFSLFGLVCGALLGRKLGSEMWGGILGCFMIGIAAWPFMKYSVSVLGAAAGAVLGAALWRTVMLPEVLIWCGGLAGLVAGGFLAFSSFRMSVMLFSSVQGATGIMIGVLALFSNCPGTAEPLQRIVYNQSFFLPVLLLIPSLLGIMLQRRLLKGHGNWKMPGDSKG